MSSYIRFSRAVCDESGIIIPNVTVEVQDPDTGSAIDIWEDDGSTPLSNPFDTGADGIASFYADVDNDPVVTIELSKTGFDFSGQNDALENFALAGVEHTSVDAISLRGGTIDVDLHNPDPADGEALVWNETESRWEAGENVSIHSDEFHHGPFYPPHIRTITNKQWHVGLNSGVFVLDDEWLIIWREATGHLRTTDGKLVAANTRDGGYSLTDKRTIYEEDDYDIRSFTSGLMNNRLGILAMRSDDNGDIVDPVFIYSDDNGENWDSEILSGFPPMAFGFTWHTYPASVGGDDSNGFAAFAAAVEGTSLDELHAVYTTNNGDTWSHTKIFDEDDDALGYLEPVVARIGDEDKWVMIYRRGTNGENAFAAKSTDLLSWDGPYDTGQHMHRNPPQLVYDNGYLYWYIFSRGTRSVEYGKQSHLLHQWRDAESLWDDNISGWPGWKVLCAFGYRGLGYMSVFEDPAGMHYGIFAVDEADHDSPTRLAIISREPTLVRNTLEQDDIQALMAPRDAETYVIFVDETNGSAGNSGLDEDLPVKTLQQAFDLLPRFSEQAFAEVRIKGNITSDQTAYIYSKSHLYCRILGDTEDADGHEVNATIRLAGCTGYWSIEHLTTNGLIRATNTNRASISDCKLQGVDGVGIRFDNVVGDVSDCEFDSGLDIGVNMARSQVSFSGNSGSVTEYGYRNQTGILIKSGADTLSGGIADVVTSDGGIWVDESPTSEATANAIAQRDGDGNIEFNHILAGIGTEGSPGISFVGDPDTGIFRPSADELGIATGGTERVRVDDGGNVGIGTTSPGAGLHLKSGEYGVFRIERTDDGWWQHSVHGTAAYRIDEYDSNWDHQGTRVAILQGGNVGIGETTPSEKLDIDGNGIADDWLTHSCAQDGHDTPHYEGDAMAELRKVRGIEGQLDRESLPAFVRRTGKRDVLASKLDEAGESVVNEDGEPVMEKVGTEDVHALSHKAMLSMLVVGLQQLDERLQKLESAGNRKP